jgi:S1-C subfamily serine protease
MIKRSFIVLLIASLYLTYNANIEAEDLHSTEAIVADTVATIVTEDWAHIQEAKRMAVVQIFNYASPIDLQKPYKTPEEYEALGSGFFINDTGDIMTNFHVIADTVSLHMQLPAFGKKRYALEFVGAFPGKDIAIVRLTNEARGEFITDLQKKGQTSIPFLSFGNSDELFSSQQTMALGYPLGQEHLKSSLGNIAGREFLLDPWNGGGSLYVQITTPINPGSSGGPLFNKKGDVVGITSCGYLWAQNVHYIIPSNDILTVLPELTSGALLYRPFLGCVTCPTTPETYSAINQPDYHHGIRVLYVAQGSLCAKAGIEKEDIICSIGGLDLDNQGYVEVPWWNERVVASTLIDRIPSYTSVPLTLLRNGTIIQKDLFIERQSTPALTFIYPRHKGTIDYEIIGGMVVMPLTLNHIAYFSRRHGDIYLSKYILPQEQNDEQLIVTHILPNSQSHKSHLVHPGALIKTINGISVRDLTRLREVLSQLTDDLLTVEFNTGLIVNLSWKKILTDEPFLAQLYRYEPSLTIQKIIRSFVYSNA